MLEQLAHRTVAAVALVLERHLALGRERRQRREDVREFRPHVVVEIGEAAPLEPAHVLVERVHEDGERQVALELRRGAREDELPSRVRASGELGQQTRLSDARLADQNDCGRAALIELGQDLIERAHLLGAPNKALGMQGHVLPPAQEIRVGGPQR